MNNLWPVVEACNNVTREVASLYNAELADLRKKLDFAMRFVPAPETMAGYCDPSAPEEVKADIEMAARLHGRTLPTPDLEPKE
jgi:hypothetical protein